MKNLTKIAISLLSLAAIPFVSGCGSSTEQVEKTTSSSTTYVPSPPRQPIIQPAPVVSLPADHGYNHRGKERVELHRYG